MNANLLSYILNGLLGTGWLTTAVIGGRKVHQKEIISQLESLVKAQGAQIAQLKEQNAQQQEQLDTAFKWIEYLEGVIDENPELVHQRVMARKQRRSRPNRPANPAPPSNR